MYMNAVLPTFQRFLLSPLTGQPLSAGTITQKQDPYLDYN